MDNIVTFPTKFVRDWLIIERAMNDVFSQNEISPSAQARLTERMKSFYETLQLDFNFTIEVQFPDVLSNDQARSICSQIGEKIGAASSETLQAFTNKLMIERLYVEIDLCRALGILP